MKTVFERPDTTNQNKPRQDQIGSLQNLLERKTLDEPVYVVSC